MAATNTIDKPEEIILGSGDLFLVEYTSEIPDDATIEADANRAGNIKGGATLEDVKLMKANVGEGVLVKAAGGISGLEDAQAFLEAGADRLGTSRVVKAVQGVEGKGY